MEQEQRQKIYKIIMLVVLTAVITFVITTVVIYKYISQGDSVKYITSDNNSEIAASLATFEKIIDKYYLGEVNQEDLLNGAIKGYISGLNDEYTEYMTKEEMTAFREETMGNYIGIGIYMVRDIERNVIVVLSPIKGTPAYEAGILPGDIIYKVNDEIYTAEQLNEASSKIKGEAGTKVKLEIIRKEETITLEIERKNIKINHVESEVIEKNIGYLKLSTFDEGSAKEFKEEFEKLKDKEIKSLIIDLRNNGGGIVDEALEIAELMTKKDEILLITADKNGKEEITKSRKEPIINMPIVLLINEHSASASEILAGILKDNQKATLVGEKSYGKGVIQQLLTLDDGSRN